jgi:hypothetical protein
LSIDALQYTLSAEWTIELGTGTLLALGASGSYQSVRHDYEFHFAAPDQTASITPPRNDATTGGVYALDRYSFFSRHLEGEIGLRVDSAHVFGDGFSLPAPAVLNPRLRVQYNPFTDGGPWSGLEFHAGSGLFSQIPLTAFFFSGDTASGVVSPSLKPVRSWITDMGGSLSLGKEWRFSVDGYYKAYWDRLYEFYYTDPATDAITLHLASDGGGYATGAEVMLQKLSGRFWDGWINYTLNLTRFRNPGVDGLDPNNIGSFFPLGAPIGPWYYPLYQSLHTANLVLNWKPLSWLTVTTTGTFATGTPTYQSSPSATYSDSSRTPNVYVVNLKVTARGSFSGGTTAWEAYAAVQNLLVNLLGSGTVAAETGDQAYFNFGYPVPSFGFKIDY